MEAAGQGQAHQAGMGQGWKAGLLPGALFLCLHSFFTIFAALNSEVRNSPPSLGEPSLPQKPNTQPATAGEQQAVGVPKSGKSLEEQWREVWDPRLQPAAWLLTASCRFHPARSGLSPCSAS